MSSLTKIEAAKRQLVTALRLFFDDCDPVSVFTLASNAWEIIDALCENGGILSLSGQTRGHLPPDKDLRQHYVNSPYRNYFKHADRDPYIELSGFDDLKNDGMLFLAVEDYIRLNHQSPLEFQVYQLWYLAIYTEKIADDALERVMPEIETTFPCIKECMRLDQKAMARAVLTAARNDQILGADPLVEH
ncbi:hypothetical protein [Thiobacillus sp.]